MTFKSPEVARAYYRQRYIANRERILAQMKEYAKAHPEVRRRAGAKWRAKNKTRQRSCELMSLYGITADDYSALLAHQGGVCAICGKPETAVDTRWTGAVKRLSVDHCHNTGAVRGLLCSACNQGLGLLKTPDIMRRAAEYMEDHA